MKEKESLLGSPFLNDVIIYTFLYRMKENIRSDVCEMTKKLNVYFLSGIEI